MISPFSRSYWVLFLQRIRRSIAVGIPSMVGNHIDVRICASILPVACANFEYSGWPA